jgi:MFS family permease
MVLRSSPVFRRLWIGQVVSVVGDGMQRLALLWWASHTGGSVLLAAVAVSAMLPVTVLSPWGGVLADRCDRRVLLVGADVARIGTTGGLALLVLGGSPPGWAVCLLVAATAAGTAVFDPTYAATVPSVVGDDDLPAANGLGMANTAVGGLAGPLVAGLLLTVWSPGVVLAVNAATFAWSAAWVVRTRLPAPAGRAPDQPEDAGRIRDGWAVVAARPRLRALVGLGAVLNMVVAPVPLLLAATAVRRFHAQSGSFGLLQVALSAGVLVGSALAGRLARGSATLPLLVTGACLAVVGGAPLLVGVAALAVAGSAIAVGNTVIITRFQREAPAELHGRLFGLVGGLAEGLRPIGAVLGVPLLAVAGPGGAFAVVGALVVVAVLASRGAGRGAPPVPAAAYGEGSPSSAVADAEGVR